MVEVVRTIPYSPSPPPQQPQQPGPQRCDPGVWQVILASLMVENGGGGGWSKTQRVGGGLQKKEYPTRVSMEVSK